jgi:hypothetical protein
MQDSSRRKEGMEKTILMTIFLMPILLIADPIEDPVQYFLNTYERAIADKLLKAKIDLNNDGIDELFLCYLRSDYPDDDYFSWAVCLKPRPAMKRTTPWKNLVEYHSI